MKKGGRTAVTPAGKERERQFALAYLGNGFNGAKAAESLGVSTISSNPTAWRWLQSSNVQAILQEELKKIVHRKRIEIADVWQEWRRLAFSNMDDYSFQDDDGNTVIRLPHGDRDLMASVKSIETIEVTKEDENGFEVTTRRTKISLHDKTNGLDKLTRLLGMYEGKEAPNVTLINGDVNVDARQQIAIVAATPADAAEEYRKLLGR